MKIKLIILVVTIPILIGFGRLTKKNNFPIILQEKAAQCGPVCLKMICEYYGKNVELKELEKLSGMDKRGTSLLGLSNAADSLGLKNVGIQLSYEKLYRKAPLPAILHWNNNHFIVVYKIKKNKVWVADPALGKVKYSKEEFCKSWQKSSNIDSPEEGIVLLLEKTIKF